MHVYRNRLIYFSRKIPIEIAHAWIELTFHSSFFVLSCGSIRTCARVRYIYNVYIYIYFHWKWLRPWGGHVFCVPAPRESSLHYRYLATTTVGCCAYSRPPTSRSLALKGLVSSFLIFFLSRALQPTSILEIFIRISPADYYWSHNSLFLGYIYLYIILARAHLNHRSRSAAAAAI